MPLSNPIQGEELVEAVAKVHAFERRSEHDRSLDADHHWKNLTRRTQAEELKAARAIIPVVLEQAAGVLSENWGLPIQRFMLDGYKKISDGEGHETFFASEEVERVLAERLAAIRSLSSSMGRETQRDG